jgi:hypothetical protein
MGVYMGVLDTDVYEGEVPMDCGSDAGGVGRAGVGGMILLGGFAEAGAGILGAGRRVGDRSPGINRIAPRSETR